MAVGKIWNTGSEHTELMGNGMNFARITRSLGRKIVVSKSMEASKSSSEFSAPPKNRRGQRPNFGRLNHLVSLPQDLLVRVLCKVDQSDLKHLLLVSKYVHETTLIARELHFAFSTPSSKPVFNVDSSDEPPNAPKQHIVSKSRIDREKLASIAVTLFPKNDSVADM